MINTGASGDAMIGTLFAYEAYYRTNNTLKYTLFPGKNSVGEHNSNSFARNTKCWWNLSCKTTKISTWLGSTT